MIDWTIVLPWVPALLYGLGLGYFWASNRRYRRLLDDVIDTATIALEILAAMEQAQDPGRDVHERLARALEPTVTLPPSFDNRPDEAGRRALAMERAALVIDAMRRANLRLVDGSDE